MTFNNVYLLEEIENLETIKETEERETEERAKGEREKQKRETLRLKQRNDRIEFIVYISLSLILVYYICKLTKNNTNGIKFGGLHSSLNLFRKAPKNVNKIGTTYKKMGKKAKKKRGGAEKNNEFNFSSSFKSSNFDSGSYSKSIINIKESGAGKVVLTLVVGGFLCIFAFMIPSLLPLFLLFVILLICKTFAVEQYNKIIK